MSEKRKLKITPAVAAFVRVGLSSGEKLCGVEAASTLSPVDHITLLFCLMRDVDESVKEAATTAFAGLPEELLLACSAVSGVHPAVLDVMARFHYSKAAVVRALLECPELSPEAGAFLNRVAEAHVSAAAGEADSSGDDSDEVPAAGLDEPDHLSEEGPEECDPDTEPPANDGDVSVLEAGEEDNEHLSKYRLIQLMGIGEKIKMAMTGDKEWRAILVNDTNKLVSSSVIKNPRITDGEILRILKVGVQNDEIVRLICDNREWVKNPLIRKALVDCPKTPLPNALRYLATLGDKEIAAYAKSKNVSSVISTQAKRIMLAKKR